MLFKKKLRTISLTILALLLIILPFCTKGDVNLDFKRDTTDFLMTYCYVMGDGDYKANWYTRYRMDTDSDGDIDLDDTVYYYDMLKGDK